MRNFTQDKAYKEKLCIAVSHISNADKCLLPEVVSPCTKPLSNPRENTRARGTNCKKSVLSFVTCYVTK